MSANVIALRRGRPLRLTTRVPVRASLYDSRFPPVSGGDAVLEKDGRGGA